MISKGDGSSLGLERSGSSVRTVSQSEWNEFATMAGLDRQPDADRCIHSAYLDLSRTLAGIATFVDAEGWHQVTAGFLKLRLERLSLRSRWSREEYDAWHRATSSKLIEAAADMGFPLTVGQTQKWVNMSIKNGIALGDRLSPSLSCVYDAAHVALDQIVLEGLRRRKGMPRELVRGAWSKLANYEEYMACQRWIRQNLPGIPVEEEFRLWQEGRVKVGPTRTPSAKATANSGARMSLEDRFQHLTGLKEEIEAEETEWRERSRREAEAEYAFWNRYYQAIQKVCQAFARIMGWKCEDHTRGHGYFALSYGIPVEGCTHCSTVSLTLTLNSIPLTLPSREPRGGSIEAYALLNVFYLAGDHETSSGYWTDTTTTTFATDVDLKAFETLVADVLEDRYRSLMVQCLGRHVDLSIYRGHTPEG